jgi:hypothetical protein
MTPLPAAFERGENYPSQRAAATNARSDTLDAGGGNPGMQSAAAARVFANVGQQGAGAHPEGSENRRFYGELGSGLQ